MTKEQEKIIEKIESLVMRLSLSDKKNTAKGEIEGLKSCLREAEKALKN